MKNRINKLFISFISCMLLFSTNVYAEDTLKLCERSGSLRVFQFIGNMINVSKIAVPLAIILYSSKDFIRAVISGSVDNIKELAITFVRRVVSGMVVFLIPAIVYIGLSIANTTAKRDAITTEFSQCNACIVGDDACKGYISTAEAIEEQEAAEDKAKRQSGDKNPVPDLTIDPGGSGNSGSGNSNIKTGTHDGYIIVGDSRTYHYAYWELFPNNQKSYYFGDQGDSHGIKLAKDGSTDISNFNDQTLCFGSSGLGLGALQDYQAYIEKYLNAHSDKSYVVLYNFGVNDFGTYGNLDNNKIQSYIAEYKEQTQSIKKINSKNNTVVISVGPVGFESGYLDGYITNEMIYTFNETVKAGIGSNIGWCNTFGRNDSGGIKDADWDKYLKGNGDNLHYSKEGYAAILNYIISNCV